MNLSPQKNRETTTENFVLKINKTRRGKGFNEDIYQLLYTGDKSNFKFFAKIPFSYKVIINFNMLCTSMEDYKLEEIARVDQVNELESKKTMKPDVEQYRSLA